MILPVVGFLLFHAPRVVLAMTAIWLPGLGLGIALVAWLGWLIVPFLAADLVLLAVVRWIEGDTPLPLGLTDAALHGGLIVISWWLYHHVAGGSRWLDDPRSATIFLLLVPGVIAALLTACCETLRRGTGCKLAFDSRWSPC